MERKKQSRVSIIMPCYNDGAYIKEAIESIKRQTWRNIELVIIDDGSDDPETLAILRTIDFPDVVMLAGEHRGPSAARNLGIQKASGQYILPVDSDDVIEDTYVEKAARILDMQPEVGIVYCHADLFGEKTGTWTLPDYSLRTFLIDNCIFVTSMFRKRHWEQVGGFCEDFVAGMEDYDFWLSLLGLGCEVVQLEETLFHYRIKASSRSTFFNNDYQAIQDTYVALYDRHREVICAHIDDYCKDLRRILIDYIIRERNNEKIYENPVLQYWRSVVILKPNRVKRFEKWLKLKATIKKALHMKGESV